MTDGNTYEINKRLNSEEDWDALQEVTAELEQAEARIAELEETLSLRTKLHGEATYVISDLEAKLAKAVEALELALELADNDLVDFSRYGLSCDADINKHYRTTLAELSSVSCANSKGQDDAE